MTEKEEAATPPAGELLVCGATDYWAIGRTKDVRADIYPNLQLPHKFKAMQVRVLVWEWKGAALRSVLLPGLDLKQAPLLTHRELRRASA